MPWKDRRKKLLDDIEERIAYFEAIGIEGINVSPDAVAEDAVTPYQALVERVLSCGKCPLAETRTQAVPGEGDSHADIMFLGEGPGHDEDVQGRPFVGRAGQLLTRIINAMGFAREDVYITNVIKCRPPNNRNPNAGEIRQCQEYLWDQLALIQPKVIVTLGNVPTQFLLDTRRGITSLRGRFHPFRDIQIMPTFHPSYLVRNEGNRELKRMVWEDMKQVLAYLGKP